MKSSDPSTRPASPSSALGPEALALLRRIAGLDDAHLLEHADGFTWWGGDVPVRFGFREAPAAQDGLPVWRIWAEVEAARGLDLTQPKVHLAIALLTRTMNPFQSAVVGDVLKFRTMTPLVSTQDARPITDLLWRSAWMLRTTERLVPEMIKRISGRRWFGSGIPRAIRSQHPTARRRRNATQLLDAFADAVMQTKTDPERRPAVEHAIRALRAAGYSQIAPANGDESPGCKVILATRRTTALLDLTLDVTHPNLGSGLLATLHLCPAKEYAGERGLALAQRLDAAEWTTLTPLRIQGAWTIGAAGAEVAYSAFHPHGTHHAALARTVALDALRRARWAFAQLGDHEPLIQDEPYAKAFAAFTNESHEEA
jgi:hypothetical protein